MRALGPIWLAGTCLVALAAPALAQEAPQADTTNQTLTPEQEIVVTGVRQSLDKARAIKRDSTQFVDAIVASDIGSLPDTNVAESLARVSGVQLDRGIGEGTSIAIRGLRQNITLYNGRELFDPTGRGGSGIDELGGSTYGLLALIPSELVASLQVTKLAGSDQIAGALGGIVDINTRKPLDNKGFHVTASGGVIYDSMSGRSGYEAFGLVSNTMANDTLGYLFSVSMSERHIAEQGLSTFSGYTAFTNGGVRRTGDADMRAQQISDDRKKLGATGVLQWRPDNGLEVTADAFYSRLTSDRDRYWIAFVPTAGLSNPVFSPNNVLLAGTSTTTPNTNMSFYDIENEVWSTAITARYQVSDALTLSGQVAIGDSVANSTRNYVRLTLPASAARPIRFDFREGDFGSFDFSNFNLSDPAGMTFGLYYDDGRRAATKNTQARGDVEYAFNSPFLSSLEIGGRYERLESTVRPHNALLRPNLPASALTGYLRLFSNSDFLPGQFAGVPRSYLGAIESAVGSCHAFTAFPTVSQDPACLNPSQSVSSLGSTYDINETFWNGYAKLNFKSDLGFAQLEGNAGVRYIGRKLESIGNILAGTTVTPTIFRRDDTDFLPSAVAKLSFNDDLVVRLGYAKVLSFPSTASLNNGIALNNDPVFANGVQIQAGTGSGGSPDLDPFSATQYDASIEYYFGKENLISIGAFYKDVGSFIVSALSPERYNNIDYVIGRATNGQNGTVKGFEVLYQQPFTFLPAPFDGFGALVTYSYIASETPLKDPNGHSFTFPGLSKNNVNLVAYYDKGPLNLRVAYNWRDAYFVSLNGSSGNGVYNDSYQDLAVTFKYGVTKNLEFRLEGINLLDSQQRSYDGFSEALVTNVRFGRVFKFGASLNF
jgi:iron complex outermembrane receptor protein